MSRYAGGMSRKREAQREKRHELARQLGVSALEVQEHRHLQENARVTRPVLRCLGFEARGGVLKRMFGAKHTVLVALYLVEPRGARLLHAAALTEGEVRLDKLSYHRPAHFLLVAFPVRDAAADLAALPAAPLTIDGLALDDPALASAGWERPRSAQLGGLPVATLGAALCLRGMARVAERIVLPLDPRAPVLEVEL